MGYLNALTGMAALGAAYYVHTVFNHPYEWALLAMAVFTICMYCPDTKLKSLINMVRWVWK